MAIFNQHGKAVANGVLVSDIIRDHLSSQELFVKRKLSFSTREEFLEQLQKVFSPNTKIYSELKNALKENDMEAEKKMRRKARKIEEILEIPVELSTNNPKITITGFERMLIENYRGILEYQDYFVRVNTYIGILNINGFNLKLEEMTTDDLLVTGRIDSIDFESVTEESED